MSTEMQHLRFGLVNYVGAMLEHLGKTEPDKKKHIVVAALTEEALKLVYADNECSLYAAKPLLRSVVHILNNRCEQLRKLPLSSATQEKILQYQSCINTINSLISSLN